MSSPRFSLTERRFDRGPADAWRRPRRRRHKSQGLAALSDLVPRAMPRNEPAEAKLARFIALWERSVPHRVSINVVPVRLRGDTVYLHAGSAVWAQEVSLLAPQLLAHVRARAPNIPFTKLAPKVGPLPVRRHVEPEPPPRVVPLAEEALPEDVKRSLAKIGDDALRATLTEAACVTLGTRPRRG